MRPTFGYSSNAKESLRFSNAALIEQYDPQGDIFFSSCACTLLAKPPFANLLVAGACSIADQAKQSLRFAKELGLEAPIVIGAIDFDGDKSSYLRISSTAEKRKGHEHFDTLNESHLKPIHARKPALHEQPSAAEFGNSVNKALEKFAKGELDKVVLSRTLRVHYDTAPNTQQLVKNLAIKNRHGYTFAIDLKPLVKLHEHHQKHGDESPLKNDVHALVGASPELLISKQGNQLIAHPLAGSEPRTNIRAIDQESESRLLASKKDHYEHALVVKAIKAALAPYCKTLTIPDKPSIVTTSTMMHLGSLIVGELKNETTTSLELALAMHPTPAVCGYPTQNAKAAITELESYPRNLFTGLVGWCDENGDGEWAVTIRCAEVNSNCITVYAGAGIVTGSCPNKETRETDAKFNTMLNAMGAAHR